MKYAFMLFMPLLFVLAFVIPDRTIHGKITDEKGKPIAGASVIIKGLKNWCNNRHCWKLHA